MNPDNIDRQTKSFIMELFVGTTRKLSIINDVRLSSNCSDKLDIADSMELIIDAIDKLSITNVLKPGSENIIDGMQLSLYVNRELSITYITDIGYYDNIGFGIIDVIELITSNDMWIESDNDIKLCMINDI
eukprot:6978293-Ditylum_brightwellii.AAC.1